MQLHIGVRYLLLAPLYGYTLRELSVDREGSQLRLLHDGIEESYSVGAFRARLRTHVREELDRLARPAARGAIELSRVAEAEAAAARGDQVRILELLGAWPAPLAIFLRTPDGQMLNAGHPRADRQGARSARQRLHLARRDGQGGGGAPARRPVRGGRQRRLRHLLSPG